MGQPAYLTSTVSDLLGTPPRTFHQWATDHATADQPPFIPDFPRMQAAARAHDMEFLPEFDWSDAES